MLLYPDLQLDVEPRSVLFDASNYSEPFPIMLRGRDDTVLEDMEHGSVLTFGLRSTDPEYAKVTLPDFRVTVCQSSPQLSNPPNPTGCARVVRLGLPAGSTARAHTRHLESIIHTARFLSMSRCEGSYSLSPRLVYPRQQSASRRRPTPDSSIAAIATSIHPMPPLPRCSGCF